MAKSQAGTENLGVDYVVVFKIGDTGMLQYQLLAHHATNPHHQQ